MKSWQTTFGGALSVLGKSLIGVGVLPQLAGTPNRTLLWIALTGFIIEAIGGFFTALFAADAKQLQSLTTQVQQNQSAILTGDTTLLRKSAEPPPAPPKP